MTHVSLLPSLLSPDTESPDTVSPTSGPAWVSAAALHFAIQQAGKESLRRGLERLRCPTEEARTALLSLPPQQARCQCSGQWCFSELT